MAQTEMYKILSHPYWEVLEAQHGDDAGQETDNHGTERSQHHFTSGSHGDSTGKGSVLDVDLKQEREKGVRLISDESCCFRLYVVTESLHLHTLLYFEGNLFAKNKTKHTVN